jgi:hypothetical protein
MNPIILSLISKSIQKVKKGEISVSEFLDGMITLFEKQKEFSGLTKEQFIEQIVKLEKGTERR